MKTYLPTLTERTARNDHECAMCEVTIAKGDRYLDVENPFVLARQMPGVPLRYRVCLSHRAEVEAALA